LDFDTSYRRVGFQITDEFVIGLDFAKDYRNRRDICVLSEA
jgi:hypoxanthine-guanine phosphoribosyltransferase